MAKAPYLQYCAVARALDVVGDRWTFLIVRELATGPRRNVDIREALPGIATNILAERLRHLVDADIAVRRDHGPPINRQLYELTERGRALMPVLDELGRWGMPLLGEPRPNDRFRLAWALLTLERELDLEAALEDTEVFELRVGDEVANLAVSRRGAHSEEAPASSPDYVLRASPSVFARWIGGSLTNAEAQQAGLDGDPKAIKRFSTLFRIALGRSPAVPA